MKHKLNTGLLLAALVALGCGTFYRAVPLAWAEETASTPAANVVLSMDGPGGRVSLGDDVAQAKKAFPARKGAQIREYPNPGTMPGEWWEWSTQKPLEEFKVEFVDGKVTTLTRNVFLPSEASRRNLVAQTLEKAGKPYAHAEGKIGVLSSWKFKTYVRLLMEFKLQDGTGRILVSSTVEIQRYRKFKWEQDTLESIVKYVDNGAVMPEENGRAAEPTPDAE